MGHSTTRQLSMLALSSLMAANSACSLIFVKPPESSGAVGRGSGLTECTSSKVAPVLDSVFAGVQAVRTVLAITADDRVYDDPQPLSREADVGIGFGLTALFLGSAAYGYATTSKCATAEQKQLESDDRHEWTTPVPARTIPAPTAGPA